MHRWILLLVAFLAPVILVFGFVADRAIVDQARSVESAALAEAEETARMAALSVRAALAQHELGVMAGRPPAGVTTYRRVLAAREPLRVGSSPPYGTRPVGELVDLVSRSTATTSQGLPEAVVAAAALNTVDGKAEAARRLLSGQLPVEPDDLPYLARVLELGADPRVELLEARLRAAPATEDLPIVPAFRRRLTERGSVEGWSRRDKEGIGYEVPVGALLDAARVSERAGLAAAAPSGDAAIRRVVAVPDVGGFELLVAAELPSPRPIQVLRGILWAAVLTSILGLAAALRSLRREAAAVSREKQFLAGVTHELRTPLAAIRLFGETLAKGRGSAEEYGALVAQESERLEALVDRVLAVTRMEEAPSFAPVQPGEIVDSAVRLMTARAERRAVTIDWQPPSTGAALVEATWDEEAVRQALLNLLDNAIRHGGDGCQVKVTAERQGEALKVSVADDGPGIPRRDRKRIFGRFERSETESVGSGLGLALVERVARAHGGRVDLTTERNQGSTFALVLPLLPPGSRERARE